MCQETLNEHRDLFEKGSSVLVTVQASAEGDEVRVRIIAAEALDQAAHRMQKGLRIHLRDPGPLSSIASRLDKRGDGEVSIVVMLEGGKREVEVKLPGRFSLSPLVAGALKAVPGVVAVEAV